MSRRRRLRISLLIGTIPAVAIAIGGLWGTAEEGGFDADTCGSIVHRASDSAFCRSALTETYVQKLVAAVVAGLALAAVVFGLLTLVRWIKRGRRPGSLRWRLGLVGSVTLVLLLATTTTVVVAHQTSPNPCQPAARPVRVAASDRVSMPLGDAGLTGQVDITAPKGRLASGWCSQVELDPEPVGGLPVMAGGRLFGSIDSRVVAVDLSTGRTIWRASAIGEPVALVAGGLLVRGYDQVYDLNARTGRQVWVAEDSPGSSRHDSGVSPGDLSVAGGRVYVTSQELGPGESALRVLDLTTGRSLGFRAVGTRLGHGIDVPLVAGGVVAVATEANAPGGPASTHLEVFDAATLATRWSVDVAGGLDRMLAIDGQLVGESGGPGGTHLFDLHLITGRPGWSMIVPPVCGVESLLAAGTEVIDTVGGPSICAGTHAYDAVTGTPRWVGPDVGQAWVSGDRVVGLRRIPPTATSPMGTQAASLDAATGGDHLVLSTVPADMEAPALVGGLMLSTEDVNGLEAYGPS